MTNGGDAPRALSEPVWLDGVPTHWKIDRLKWSITGLFNGVWGDEPNGIDDIICVRVADFDRTRLKVTDDPPTRRAIEIKDRTNRLLHTGDLLIEKSGGGDNQPVGCVVYFDHGYDTICSNFIGRMVIAPGMHPRYWSYAHASLYTGRLNIPAIKQTTGIQNLDTDAYLNQRVAYPLLEEQCVIANYLDRETAQIDALMAAKERLLTLLAEKRRASRAASIPTCPCATRVCRGWWRCRRIGNSLASQSTSVHWLTTVAKRLKKYRLVYSWSPRETSKTDTSTTRLRRNSLKQMPTMR